MKKLWEKSPEPDQGLIKEVEVFETKDDLLMDQFLTHSDALASIAHAKMLKKIGILTKSELDDLEKGLNEIISLDKKGKFKLKIGEEDIHTKIENYLTQKYGDVGKKIHTGRSRNDQILTALRLYTKGQLGQISAQVIILINKFAQFGTKYGVIPMPGYTHMQKAMPSSIGLWTDSFKASLQDDLTALKTVSLLVDQSPLGSGAGYGVPLELDKNYTAKLLGFSRVQENPIYCQNSKGKLEGIVLAALISLLQTINKFSTDILLFTTSEFDLFKIVTNITSGSSMMPQKRNLDLAELLRSKVHLVLGNYTKIISMSSNLISGYNRDLQDIKKPLIESLEIALNSVKACQVLLQGIEPNKQALGQAMTNELFATEKALDLVSQGKTFRDAYQQISQQYPKGGEKNAKKD